jgi:hypothetical protein
LAWPVGTMVLMGATGFIAGRAILSLAAIHLQIHGSNVLRAQIVIRSRTSTSGTIGGSYAWIRPPTSRMNMLATQGPMSVSGFPFPEHDHRPNCLWASGGSHGGVAAAADTATSSEDRPRAGPGMCVCVLACSCACEHACMRACMHACACACACPCHLGIHLGF